MLTLEDIKKWRKSLEITQKELSKAAGISQSMISKMEKKNANPSYNLVLKIVEFLEKYESPKEKTKKAPRAVLKTKVFTPLPFSQRDMNQYYQFKSAQRKIKRQEQC